MIIIYIYIHMLDKSLFICYSTPNYEKMTNIFFESLKNINVKNINHLLQDPTISIEKTGFRTELWYYCLKKKKEHLVNVLKSNIDSHYSYFIFSDCDINYIKKNVNEWYNLEKYMIDTNKDIYFMRENVTNDVNSGFYIIKNNENLKNIIEFFIEVIKEMYNKNSDLEPNDQVIINKFKNRINFDYIPNEYVVWANYIWDINKSLFHHAVCTTDVTDKIEQINKVKSYFTD